MIIPIPTNHDEIGNLYSIMARYDVRDQLFFDQLLDDYKDDVELLSKFKMIADQLIESQSNSYFIKFEMTNINFIENLAIWHFKGKENEKLKILIREVGKCLVS